MFVVLQSSTNSYLHYKVRTKIRLFFETSNYSWIIFLISCIIIHPPNKPSSAVATKKVRDYYAVN